ncbi:hypothetical protein O6H91_Y374700 [Diphasiastrum complanatum]|nr:hypothetical protein O6H91_Y374700 [Diphasiastrum complanatum]
MRTVWPISFSASTNLSYIYGPLASSMLSANCAPLTLSRRWKDGLVAFHSLSSSQYDAVGCGKSSVLGGWRNSQGLVKYRRTLGFKHGSCSGVPTRASSSPVYSGHSGGSAGAEEKPPTSFVWSDKKRPRICILGGGFGGLYTALRLETLVWPPGKQPQVLVVDQSDRFVFKPMLYELLSKEVDPWEIAPLFADLLSSTSIQFRKDKVVAVCPCDGGDKLSETRSGGIVYLGSGISVEYDWLVLALGAESKLDVVPGALDYALPFNTLEDALEVDRRLKSLERERFEPGKPPIRVVIVGAGYSGIELAATVSERLGKKGIVQVVNPSSEICPTASAGSREAAIRVLSSRKVELILCYFVSAIKVSPEVDNVFVLDLMPATRSTRRSNMFTKNLEADLVLWTVGNKPLVPSNEPGSVTKPFLVNGRGQAETDETLRVKGHPRIFAIGDSASTRDSSGRLLAATAQVAFQQADYAGWNLWAAINNRPLLPFRYQHLGELMVLGSNDAAVTPGFIEGFTLDGSLGHTVRKLAYLYRLPTNEHRVKVGLSWLGKTTIKSISDVQDTLTKLIGQTSAST